MFKRKPLYSALVHFGIVGAVLAVRNPSGSSQSLIYPYYGSGWEDHGTLLSIVNSTSKDKAMNVRFIGQGQRELLNLDVALSPFAVWTAAFAPRTGESDARAPSPSFGRADEGYFEIIDMTTPMIKS